VKQRKIEGHDVSTRGTRPHGGTSPARRIITHQWQVARPARHAADAEQIRFGLDPFDGHHPYDHECAVIAEVEGTDLMGC
jgi:hypothetical protein